ncbi:S8 family peptidase [Haloactinopolyspora alba]|nr:S8 family peptidase [Haloactinopolyspora alba]
MVSTPRRGRARLLSAAAAASLAAATAGGVAFAVPTAPKAPSGPIDAHPIDAHPIDAQPIDGQRADAGGYIVVLEGQPAASYRGGVSGLARTAPAAGERLRPSSAAVRDYRAHLRDRQLTLARDVGVRPVHRYTVALNGFSARLSAEQVRTLRASPGVRAVVADVPRKVDTVHSPEFLGLTGDDGLWESVGGSDRAGHGTVVGVIDTGIWPENPSFAGDELPDGSTGEVGRPYRTSETGTAMLKADGDTFTGACRPGEGWTPDLCNDKLISARYFEDGFVTNVAPEHRGEHEQISARDGDGHGTHTAATAAGNHHVEMSVDGRSFGSGSGMAPGAKIAAYKVCWQDDDAATGGCYPSDSVAAIEQAVLDGVDVINYSISGATDTVMDPVELAFLSAASANVFVAASAGNSGPEPSTVAHNSPWLTSVAASTHVRYEGTVELGDGRRFRGAMIDDTGVPERSRLLYAGDIPAQGVDAADAALCAPDSLDATAVAEAAPAVVLCDRGEYPRVDKSAEVARAGGVGTVLGNTDPADSLNADLHTIPTTHVPAGDADAIRSYATSRPDATAALLPGDRTDLPPTPLPVVAGFSSRGPAEANGGDVLKPDVAAPGVDVLAAVAPGPHNGNDFDFLSGTSMAAPHVAGLAAVMRAERPEWSAMAVKSALMTTASEVKTTEGENDADRFGRGAGNVDPTRFLDPGLVYEAGPDDWLSFLEGTGENLGVDGVEPIDPSNLNQPSVAVGALAGRQVITREVTAVTPGLYRAEIDVPGFDARVRPSVLHFARPGQTKRFEIVLDRETAPLGTYAQGELTWSGGGTTVRSPVVARPVAVAAPPEVTGTGTSGEIRYEVVPGSDGDVDLTTHGLAPGEVTEGSLTPGEPADTEGNSSSQVVTFEVPEGTTTARFDLVSGAAHADYDMYLYGPGGKELPVEGATGSTSERVDLTAPRPGTYRVLVHMFSSADGSAAEFDLRTFSVGSESGHSGAMSVTPDPIPGRRGEPSTVTVQYDGLRDGTPYLATIGYEGTATLTTIMIN